MTSRAVWLPPLLLLLCEGAASVARTRAAPAPDARLPSAGRSATPGAVPRSAILVTSLTPRQCLEVLQAQLANAVDERRQVIAAANILDPVLGFEEHARRHVRQVTSVEHHRGRFVGRG